VTDASFDQQVWEQRWEGVLATHASALAARQANADLLAVAAGLPPGRALDAGCGHGAESLSLAAAGWRVTAVDFAQTALDIGRGLAETMGPDVAGRVEWVQGDLGTWAPEPAAYDLVACLYVHVAGSVGEMVARLAAGVAPGGTLLLVGHLDAPGQQQVTLADALPVLDAADWEVLVAEERPRSHGVPGTDAVIRARRVA
jgi:2-polyprenyl-3-methyl-5-hydroxy-6-metoxy-1,4-benzoquinol methylase